MAVISLFYFFFFISRLFQVSNIFLPCVVSDAFASRLRLVAYWSRLISSSIFVNVTKSSTLRVKYSVQHSRPFFVHVQPCLLTVKSENIR